MFGIFDGQGPGNRGALPHLIARCANAACAPDGATRSIALLMARAQILWLRATLGALLRAGQSWGGYKAECLRLIANLAAGECERDAGARALLDVSLAQLREIVEQSQYDARALETTLGEIAAQLATLLATPHTAPVRRGHPPD